jgi:hypothetical protein
MGLKLREKYLLLLIGLLALLALAALLITLRKDEFTTTGRIHSVRDVPNRWAMERQPVDNEFERIQRELMVNSTKDKIVERRNFVKGVSFLLSNRLWSD